VSSKPSKSNKPKPAAKPVKPAKPLKPAGPVPSQAGLSKAELQEYKNLLLVRKRVLQGDVKGLENEAMKKGGDGGDLSTLPMHLADLGTDNFEQDLSLGLMESESDELQQIEEAFERIIDGSFGLCETCKKKIPKERLKAIPYARLCIGCKMKEEGV
jgi:RNA polymerase-binding transcription factor DksA